MVKSGIRHFAGQSGIGAFGLITRIGLTIALAVGGLQIAPWHAAAVPPATVTWDSQADFENNAGSLATTRQSISTTTTPGSAVLAATAGTGTVRLFDAGHYHTVGLKPDGTVVAVGDNSYGQSNVSTWAGITAVSAGYAHTAGLESDGTVVATGHDDFGQVSGVASWTEIVELSVGDYHTVGLKADGTVLAVGYANSDRLETSGWTDIVAVSAGGSHTVGLKSDGTVVAVGADSHGQVSGVAGWTDVVSISAGFNHTVGLKSDGTVIAVGRDDDGQVGAVSSWAGVVAIRAGGYHTVGLKSDGTVVSAGNDSYGQCGTDAWANIVAIETGFHGTMGLRSDGTLVAIGDNSEGQADVAGWGTTVMAVAGAGHSLALTSAGTVLATGYDEYGQRRAVAAWPDVIAIAAAGHHSVGLKSDGTVVADGYDWYGQTSGVASWTDIVAVYAGFDTTFGLKANGTVVAVGDNGYGQTGGVAGWTDIIQVAAGDGHALGLRSDGRVVAVGDDWYGMTNTAGWSNIVAIAAGHEHSVGLKSDGTVVAVGSDDYGQTSGVAGWTDIVAISANYYQTVGLKSDGTVVRAGRYEVNTTAWTDIVEISAGADHVLGRKSDGTVVAAGLNGYGQLDVSAWTLYSSSHEVGVLGGASPAVGLRGPAGAALTSIAIEHPMLQPTQAVKAAVRVSDDGVHWSELLGYDGQPIDWTSETGNYFGRAATDAEARTQAVSLPDHTYADITLRLESASVLTLEVLRVMAEFERAGYTITATAGPNGSITPSGATSVLHGADAAFTITPNAGYRVADVKVDGSSIGAVTGHTFKAVDAAHTIEATFAQNALPPRVQPKVTTLGLTSKSNATLGYGSVFKVTGRLTAAGVPIAGRQVTLLAAAPGKAFAPTSMKVSTDLAGTFSFSVKPSVKTLYRVRFTGDESYGASLSGDVYARPKVSLGTPVAPKTVKPSKSFTVYGSLKPKHSAGTKPVRIYKYKKVGRKWIGKGYVKATAFDAKGNTRYRVKMKLTKGTWRLRAYAPADGQHAATWSAKYDTVTVK